MRSKRWSRTCRAVRQLQFNLATQAKRQAGSSFKPFTLATAFGQHVSPYSYWNGPPELVLPDQRCYYQGKPWDVHNYADESAGAMNLIDATAHSVNTIFAQLAVDVGPQNIVKVAHRLGITSTLQPVCSITLGTQGVSPLEMADAYATLAARGVHHPAEAIQRVRNSQGKLIESLRWNGVRAIPQNDADMVTYVLQSVLQYGTGTAAYFGRPAAGKTGTAENYDDAWFCGYVPQLAACVWVGYPNGEIPLLNVEGVPAVFGGSLPADIWHAFMSEAIGNAARPRLPAAELQPVRPVPAVELRAAADHHHDDDERRRRPRRRPHHRLRPRPRRRRSPPPPPPAPPPPPNQPGRLNGGGSSPSRSSASAEVIARCVAAST